MTKVALLLPVAVVGSLLAGAAAGQIFSRPAHADLKMGVALSATEAKAIPCGKHRGVSCFRMFVQAESSDGNPRRVAVDSADYNYALEHSFAYLESGGMCQAYINVRAAQVKIWSNRTYTLPAEPETVGSGRPFAFPIEFSCDQQADVGTSAKVQITIAVGNGDFSNSKYSDYKYEEARLIPYKWPDIKIGAVNIR